MKSSSMYSYYTQQDSNFQFDCVFSGNVKDARYKTNTATIFDILGIHNSSIKPYQAAVIACGDKNGSLTPTNTNPLGINGDYYCFYRQNPQSGWIMAGGGGGGCDSQDGFTCAGNVYSTPIWDKSITAKKAFADVQCLADDMQSTTTVKKYYNL